MRHDRHLAALLLAGAALLTTSCSAQQDAPTAAPSTPTPSASATPSAAAGPEQTPTPTPPPALAATGASMTISGFAYVVPASVRPGEQITVVNQDREAHTVTIDRGAVRLSVLPGETAVFAAPTTPGSHPVTCDLHGGMDTVLVVA